MLFRPIVIKLINKNQKIFQDNEIFWLYTVTVPVSARPIQKGYMRFRFGFCSLAFSLLCSLFLGGAHCGFLPSAHTPVSNHIILLSLAAS